MKPEARSDLFALAATFYHLSTGKAPEGFYTAKEIETQLKENSPSIPKEYRWFYDLIRINMAEDIKEVVEAGIVHHRRYLMFRRSLRQLSVDSAVVRAARAESRLRQIAQIGIWTGRQADTGRMAVWLLQMERLSDAVAEGELADMGLSETEARAELGRIAAALRG